MTCVCGHPERRHGAYRGCYGPPSTFRPDRGLCGCVRFTRQCGCGGCKQTEEGKP